jgi:hypothetical protein
MSWLLRPYTDPAFYRAIGYLLLGLPLGIFEYTVVITGLSLGAGLAITLLGVPVLVATFLLAAALSTFERELAATMLGAAMPRRIYRRDAPGLGWKRLWVRVRDRRTWSEVAFLVLVKLPLGTAGFVLVVTLFALALGVVAQPILIAAGVSTQFGGWTIDTYAESLVFAPLSVLLLLIGPRLVLAWATFTSRVTTRMLGWLDPADLKRGVVDVLARVGSADAFALLDEIGFMLGTGPFLTATKLEATLLALESTGRIAAVHEGTRTTYALAMPVASR